MLDASNNSRYEGRFACPKYSLDYRSFDFERGRISFLRSNNSRISHFNWRRRVYRKSCDFDFIQVNRSLITFLISGIVSHLFKMRYSIAYNSVKAESMT